MSLVAYDGSDDSNEEEQEAEAVPSFSKSSPIVGHISDEEDDFAGVSSSTGGSLHSFVYNVAKSDTEETDQSKRVNSTSLASLEDLPAPKQKFSEDDSLIQETELESEVLLKAAELADAPKPPKKKRQPARISIPTLNNNDEEEDEDVKKPKPSTKPSGLFSLLPAPVHSSKKEINRPLIPHSLSKKTAAIKDTQVKEISSSESTSKSCVQNVSTKHPPLSNSSVKHMSTFNALTGYDSDSDDNDPVEGSSINFFSLSQSSGKAVGKEEGASTAAVDSTVMTSETDDINGSKASHLAEKEKGKEGEMAAEGEEENKDDPEEEEEIMRVELGAMNNAPLDFSGSHRLHSWTSASYNSNLLPVGCSGPVGSSGMPVAYAHFQAMPGNEQSGTAFSFMPEEGEFINTQSSEVPSQDLKQFMSDKELHRLQGKRKHGVQEQISFVDARVDDYVDPSEVSKHMTEETGYVSSKKDKDNMPTSQQKRKKQITYLAYQAKEKEFELKNAWAQNRQTKKQTQSKYGF